MSPLLLSLRFLQAQPDSRLVALTRQGHGPAFEALVRRYRGELLAYCRRIQPRSGLAEDALQQTLLQAWKALSEGAEVREVRAWLYRIAHNVSLNHLRAANAVPREFAAATEQPGLDQLVEQRLRARAALAGLASLPALQREALLSTTFDGASHTEVASALGLSSGAVRGLIYRARATLRAAAAAVVPGPMLHWAIRRTTVGSGRFPSAGGTFVGGGGGAAGAIAKGGVVLVLAAASASGVVFTNHARHHQKPKARLMRSHHGARSAAGAGDSGVIAAGTTAFARFGAGAQPPPGSARATAHRTAGGEGAERGRGRGSGGNPDGSSGGGGGRSDGRGGSDGDSTGGSDGGSTSGSSDGDAATSMAPAAAPNTGSSEGGSSSGPDGGSGSSSGTSTSATSGSDLDTTAASATTASGTSSGSGGGSGGGASGGSDGSSGSSDGSSPSGG